MFVKPPGRAREDLSCVGFWDAAPSSHCTKSWVKPLVPQAAMTSGRKKIEAYRRLQNPRATRMALSLDALRRTLNKQSAHSQLLFVLRPESRQAVEIGAPMTT